MIKVFSDIERFDILNEELELVKDVRIKMWLEDCIRLIPNYTFEIASSSSGLNHPAWDCGEGGCIRHIKAVTKIAYELCGTFLPPNNPTESEVITSKVVAAALLHDSFKYGIEYDLRAYKLHPYYPRLILSKVEGIDNGIKEWIFRAIEAHMGSMYNGSWDILPQLTKNNLERDPLISVIHLADFMASRYSYVDVRFTEFDKPENRKQESYDQFSEGVVKGLIIGIATEMYGDNYKEFVDDDVISQVYSRVSAVKTSYSRRLKEWNLTNILIAIQNNLPLFSIKKA